MRKPDDSKLTPEQYISVRYEAERLLNKADALGRFPTPVTDILMASDLAVDLENVLDEDFLALIRKRTSSTLKQALGKILGLLDVKMGRIFIDQSVHEVKQTFLKLHETGHATLPWQRDIYSIIEDCEKTLSPEISDLFDKEANVFASEVLFQLDNFAEEASDYKFEIKTPIQLSRKYGASIYSAMRRYVLTHPRACCVLVLNPPKVTAGGELSASLRRVENSPKFEDMFGGLAWPGRFTLNDQIGALIPIRRRITGARSIQLVDRNGDRHECIAEAFTNTYQVFILIHLVRH